MSESDTVAHLKGLRGKYITLYLEGLTIGDTEDLNNYSLN